MEVGLGFLYDLSDKDALVCLLKKVATLQTYVASYDILKEDPMVSCCLKLEEADKELFNF